MHIHEYLKGLQAISCSIFDGIAILKEMSEGYLCSTFGLDHLGPEIARNTDVAYMTKA